jgi:hypothetical protein
MESIIVSLVGSFILGILLIVIEYRTPWFARYVQKLQDDNTEKEQHTVQIKRGGEQARPLSALNPIDYFRLLWWLLVTPWQLRNYRKSYGDKSDWGVGRGLVATLACLPLFILTQALAWGFLPGTVFRGLGLFISCGQLVVWLVLVWISGLTDEEQFTKIPVAVWLIFAVFCIAILLPTFNLVTSTLGLIFKELGIDKPGMELSSAIGLAIVVVNCIGMWPRERGDFSIQIRITATAMKVVFGGLSALFAMWLYLIMYDLIFSSAISLIGLGAISMAFLLASAESLAMSDITTSGDCSSIMFVGLMEACVGLILVIWMTTLNPSSQFSLNNIKASGIVVQVVIWIIGGIVVAVLYGILSVILHLVTPDITGLQISLNPRSKIRSLDGSSYYDKGVWTERSFGIKRRGRLALITLLISNAFIVWFSLMKGWQVF